MKIYETGRKETRFLGSNRPEAAGHSLRAYGKQEEPLITGHKSHQPSKHIVLMIDGFFTCFALVILDIAAGFGQLDSSVHKYSCQNSNRPLSECRFL